MPVPGFLSDPFITPHEKRQFEEKKTAILVIAPLRAAVAVFKTRGL